MNIIIPQTIREQFDNYLNTGRALDIQQRVAGCDASVWSDDDNVKAAIDQRLGWITCIDGMLTEVPRIESFSHNVWQQGYRRCVLLGMGGSSLAPEAFSRIFSAQAGENKLTLDVLDNTCADAVMQTLQGLDWGKTLFIVASKSGTTVESDSLFRFFFDELSKQDKQTPGRHFVAITDAGSPLQDIAQENDFLDCFINPADIGGRFSVLSYFGLVPAALVGVDPAQLLNSAKSVLAALIEDGGQVNQCTKLGIAMGLAAEAGLDKLVLSLEAQLVPFAAWLEQLVAESTGKDGKGILPVIQVLPGDQANSSHYRFMAALQAGGDPNPSVYEAQLALSELGGEFFKWEWATAIAGAVMQINPFDEPNVSENKRVTMEVLQQANQDVAAQLVVDESVSIIFDGQSQAVDSLQNRINQLLSDANATDYLAVLAYAPDAYQIEQCVETFRRRINQRSGMYTTFGHGPRYLHSTGQLHKGGANDGIFLLITCANRSTVAIPGREFTFEQLNTAQALGDLKVLKARERRILHVHLPSLDEPIREQLEQALSTF